MFGNNKMKVYGENETHYGGYLILQNKKYGNKSKHYISAVDKKFNSTKDVSIWVRDKYGDVSIDYKVGSNPKIDLAIQTWVTNRKKNGMRVPDNLPSDCYKRKWK